MRIDWFKPTRFTVPIFRDEKQRLAARGFTYLSDADSPDRINWPGSAMVKAAVGVRIKENPREVAFCAYTIMQCSLCIIPGATRDERFAANPLVVSGHRYHKYRFRILAARQCSRRN